MAHQSPYTGETQRIDDPTRAAPTTRPFDPHQPSAAQRRGRSCLMPALVLAGALVLVCGIVGSSLSFGWGVGRTLTLDERYDARSLELSIGAGSVMLEGSDGDQIDVQIEQHSFGLFGRSDHRAQPVIEQDGDTLRIVTPRRSGFWWGRSPSTDVRITLPRDAEIQASTGSGSINAGTLGGPVTLSAGSGSIDVRDLGGTLDLETGSGSISVRDSRADELRLNTGSGNVEIDGVRGVLEAETGSGSITVANAQDVTLDLQTSSGNISFDGSLSNDDDHQVSTGSGSIRLVLASDTNVEVEASTGSGHITSDWQLSGDDDERQGTIGSGGAELRLDTGSGNITIEER